MVLGFTQCDSFFNEKEESFDPRDHPLIEKGDTLVFNGSEHVDTFYVIESEFYLPHMREGDDQADYEQYYGKMWTSEALRDTIIRFDIVIIKYLYTIRYYYPFRTLDWEPYISPGHIEKSNSGHSIIIGNTSLVDLHKVSLPKSTNYPDMFKEIDSAYFSKTYGIVKYIKFTGEKFVLSEECLEMLMARE